MSLPPPPVIVSAPPPPSRRLAAPLPTSTSLKADPITFSMPERESPWPNPFWLALPPPRSTSTPTSGSGIIDRVDAVAAGQRVGTVAAGKDVVARPARQRVVRDSAKQLKTAVGFGAAVEKDEFGRVVIVGAVDGEENSGRDVLVTALDVEAAVVQDEALEIDQVGGQNERGRGIVAGQDEPVDLFAAVDAVERRETVDDETEDVVATKAVHGVVAALEDKEAVRPAVPLMTLSASSPHNSSFIPSSPLMVISTVAVLPFSRV